MKKQDKNRILILVSLIFFICATSIIDWNNNSNTEKIPSNKLLSIPIASNGEYNLTIEDIWIRDPNIIYFNGSYYMTGTTAWNGFLGYSSLDLENWKAEGHIFTKNFTSPWAKKLFWAPEIHAYKGQFYLFYTAATDDGDEEHDDEDRATGVAVANHPLGPYTELMANPLTPQEYKCLDGHFFQDLDGNLYFIYVFEWLNNGIGEMWCQEISPDLKTLLGEPVSSFKGTDPLWGDKVVDGPCMVYFEEKYHLFWSSFDQRYGGKYCVGYSVAEDIWGPYEHCYQPVVQKDGGHPTIFWEKNDTSLRRLITYHQPNGGEDERAKISELLWDQEKEIWYIYPEEFSGFPNYVLIIAFVAVILLFRFIKPKKN